MSTLSKIDSDLEKAITRGDLAWVNEALTAGASPNAVGKLGYPMISWAVVSKAPVEVFDALIRAGADVARSSLDGAKPGVVELATLFCRAELCIRLSELGFMDLDSRTRSGVLTPDAYRHGDAATRSKMDLLIRSLQTARAIDASMGPLEEAFAPTMGRPEAKGMSPL
jgi:hypothetical protein